MAAGYDVPPTRISVAPGQVITFFVHGIGLGSAAQFAPAQGSGQPRSAGFLPTSCRVERRPFHSFQLSRLPPAITPARAAARIPPSRCRFHLGLPQRIQGRAS